MQVEVDITRGDIVRFNLSKLFVLKSNLVTLAFAYLIATIVSFAGARTSDGEFVWQAFLIVAGIGGMAMFLAIFVCSLVFVMINSTMATGVIGKHTFSIDDAGLRERTDANDTLNYWHALRKARKSRTMIFVETAPWLFYILPRRDFESDEAYDAFFNEIRSRSGK